RLNEDTILEDKWPDDPIQQRLFLGRPLTDLLERDDYRKHPEYIRYTLRGTPVLREIRECIKDAQDRPYIPGSSLKGALRTALLRAQTDGRAFRRTDFGRAGGSREAKAADDMLERAELGRDPNRDVLRALQIADSSPLSTAALTLQHVQMVPGLTIDVEAIARGSRLTAGLRLDTWLLAQRGQRGLEWSEELIKRLAAMERVAQFVGQRRLKHEFEYHAGHKNAAAATFYGKLLEEIAGNKWPKNEFVIQVGFATGWRAKTVVGALADDDPLLETLVRDFQLDRGGGRRSRGYTRGQAFPKARHMTLVGNNPALPMGWLRIRMVKLGE
ncbi:MAG: type III-A CRISPR-associated RAMP protein Csm5, partial [Chloroflexi bacterium]|nr:type III-A CRISPR-associated RAMP protein Csm5 [Chloroflexota bacterium]